MSIDFGRSRANKFCLNSCELFEVVVVVVELAGVVELLVVVVDSGLFVLYLLLLNMLCSVLFLKHKIKQTN